MTQKYNLKEKFQKTQFDGYRDLSQGSFASDGKSVFYSGDIKNREAAQKHAQQNGMKLIQDTQTGKTLSNLDNGNFKRQFEEPGDKKIWDAASRKYAASVEGQVRTFVGGSREVSTFRRVELPAILKNKNVTQINGIDREKIDQLKHKNFERLRTQGVERREAAKRAGHAAYAKVALGEVRQDLKHAELTKDENMLQDANRRLVDIRKQARLENQARREQHQSVQKKISPESTKKDAPEFTQAERYKKIEQRVYDRKILQGISPENSRQSAQDRSKHIQQRMELAVERNTLRKEGGDLSIQKSKAHHERREAYQKSRIEDLQRQATKENRQYKGPPIQTQDIRKIETDYRAESFVKNVRLDASREEGRFTGKDYEERKSQIREGIAARREESIRQCNQSQQQSLDKSQTTSQSQSQNR